MRFSLLMTLTLWGINRTWLSAFLPWEMSEERFAMMDNVVVAPDHTTLRPRSLPDLNLDLKKLY